MLLPDSARRFDIPARESIMSAMRTVVLFVACALALGTACAKRGAVARDSRESKTGSVICSVSDYWSGDPLMDAPIGLHDTDTTSRTDLNGQCRIVLPPGQYRLSASYQGYEVDHKQVIVEQGRATHADFHLRPTEPRKPVIIRDDATRH